MLEVVYITTNRLNRSHKKCNCNCNRNIKPSYVNIKISKKYNTALKLNKQQMKQSIVSISGLT